jgi:methylase of polypeptide subunit release factors
MIALKRRLEAAGLNEDAIAAAFGSVASLEAADVHLRRLETDRGRASLIRLFVLGEAVPADSLPLAADELEAAGLVEREGDLVRSSFRLTPNEGLLLAHDGEERVREADYVGGVNNATRTLSTLTIREPVARALDLGTGWGVQALLASRHAETTIATDVNGRALDYARLNCDLNGIEVDLRQGSWFEPVVGESFDLIVSNPPFVISPDSSYVFRDSDLDGDAVSRDIVRGAAGHLRPGGHATILCNWICRSRDETWQPLEEWVGGTGCDALLLAHEPVEPFTYAARWNEPLHGDRKAYAAAVERWLDYYERGGIAALGIGAVVLRRREGENWRRGHDLSRPATGRAGAHLLRLFAAVDAPLGDAADLLGRRFRLVEGHRLDQSLRYARDTYELGTVRMSLDDGVGLVADVDASALPVLFALDPARSLGETIAEAKVDRDEAIPTVRRLYELGFLERA